MNENLTQIFNLLTQWYENNKRDLPFRRTKDPYKILVSEIMSHQTQITTLVPYYERFIQRYPSAEALAESSLDEVLSYWEGLGYYNRAKNLQNCAKTVAASGFPRSYEEILKLPGVGPYTAGAISSICFGEKKASVDGNTLRVLTRVLALDLDIAKEKTKKVIASRIEENMTEDPGTLNQAILDLASAVCLPKNPKCSLCPVRDQCLSFNKGLTEVIPVKSKKQKKVIENNEALIIEKDGRLLFKKRQDESLLNKTYGFPVLKRDLEDGKAVKDLAKDLNLSLPVYLGSCKHQFSHIQWVTDVYLSKANDNSKLDGFVSEASVVPTAFKRMIEVYKKSPHK